ncbi:MAG: YbaK/EbsC family protein [Candidatus Devosia euplotis]|nr:YbaK/EbsC family protein [Candidatus Devosia euplotis]
MSLQSVTADLAARAPDLVVEVTANSTATVQTAALVHGVEPSQIAKTLCIRAGGELLLLVTRGDARLDNQKAKAAFGGRPRMLGAEEVEPLTSHKVGGVCPFGLPGPLPIHLDASLRIYDQVIPAGGDTHASVRLSVDRLAELCGNRWVDTRQPPAALAGTQAATQ